MPPGGVHPISFVGPHAEVVAGIGDNGDDIRVGAGLEYKPGGNMFLKGEYRYSNYEGDVERHQIIGGLDLRF